MAGSYSRIVEFEGTASTPVCVELPTVPRGLLRRFVIKQASGTSASGAFTLYDRKGACVKATDLNVTESGTVTSVANSSGSAQITFAAATNLKVGDVIEIKGNSVSAYNVQHTIVSKTSATVFVSDVSYTSNGSGGLWQTTPFMPTYDPAMHAVYGNSVTSGAFSAYDLYISFENRDNQSPTMRTRYQALWLEFTPSQNGTFQAAITTESDAAVL